MNNNHTCTDCKNYKFCLESDRMYICKDFKKKERKYAEKTNV